MSPNMATITSKSNINEVTPMHKEIEAHKHEDDEMNCGGVVAASADGIKDIEEAERDTDHETDEVQLNK